MFRLIAVLVMIVSCGYVTDREKSPTGPVQPAEGPKTPFEQSGTGSAVFDVELTHGGKYTCKASVKGNTDAWDIAPTLFIVSNYVHYFSGLIWTYAANPLVLETTDKGEWSFTVNLDSGLNTFEVEATGSWEVSCK